MQKNNLQKYRAFSNFTSGIFRKNVIISFGLALTPIIGGATTLKNALAISLAMFFTLLPVMIISSILPSKLNDMIKIPTLVVSSMLFLSLSVNVIKLMGTGVLESLGVYLPMLVVNGALIVKCNQYYGTMKPHYALLDSFFTSIGYAIIAISVGSIRELLSAGTIYGIQIFVTTKIPAFRMSFLGFIILAFVIAIIRALARFIKSIIYQIDNKKI